MRNIEKTTTIFVEKDNNGKVVRSCETTVIKENETLATPCINPFISNPFFPNYPMVTYSGNTNYKPGNTSNNQGGQYNG